MIPSESSNSLNRWIPKLETYRAAFDQHASESPLSLVNEPLATETVEPTFFDEPSASLVPAAKSSQDEGIQSDGPLHPQDAAATPESIPFRALVIGSESEVVSVASERELSSQQTSTELPSQQTSTERAYTIPFPEPATETRADTDNAPTVLHLPIDGIVKSCRKARPYLLGFGSLGQFPSTMDQQSVQSCVARELALRVASKIDVDAMVIQLSSLSKSDHVVATASSEQSTDLQDMGGCLRATWYDTNDPRESQKIWYRQLAELSRWKQQFGLIVIDLGDAASPIAARVGRLCHGLVIQLHATQSARKSIHAINALKKQRLNILGVWSTEPSAQRRAA
jgi:hypothetical protein